MPDRGRLISIATLTDYHLQDFIICPYQKNCEKGIGIGEAASAFKTNSLFYQ